MRIATWNVNSLKARLPRVEEWLEYARPDVLCLQETKLADKAFPAMAFSALGYESVHHGYNQWNGVAILSRVGIEDPTNGFGEGVVDPYADDARMLAATCGGIRVVSVYVPNGREVPSEFYDRKLEWFERLAEWVDRAFTPDDPLVIMGDFNVAPEDRDVWSMKAFAGRHPRDRARAGRGPPARGVGPRRRVPARRTTRTACSATGTTAAATSTRAAGMRIDLVLATPPVADRVTWALVDRNARKGKQPSDHAPVLVDLDRLSPVARAGLRAEARPGSGAALLAVTRHDRTRTADTRTGAGSRSGRPASSPPSSSSS